LGISSGAALGAVLGAVLGLEWIWAGLALPAFVGAFVFAAILSAAAAKRGFETVRLLLTGVVLGFFGSSCVAIAMAVSSSSGLGGVLYWLLGDLSRAQLGGALFTLGASGILILWIYRSHRELDALLLGEEVARSLGVSTTRLRRKLIFVSSLLVALCVSSGGMIGFVGLIVPHLVRRRLGALHRSLIPVGAIAGAATVVLADTLSRVLLPQQEIPVGVVTALLGAPLFALILLKKSVISGAP
jgi:iron complex transport system permease protein